MLFKKLKSILNKSKRAKLILIFDAKTGTTLFYMRLYPKRIFIEAYMRKYHPEVKNWDYEITT